MEKNDGSGSFKNQVVSLSESMVTTSVIMKKEQVHVIDTESLDYFIANELERKKDNPSTSQSDLAISPKAAA